MCFDFGIGIKEKKKDGKGRFTLRRDGEKKMKKITQKSFIYQVTSELYHLKKA